MNQTTKMKKAQNSNVRKITDIHLYPKRCTKIELYIVQMQGFLYVLNTLFTHNVMHSKLQWFNVRIFN